MKKTLFLRVFLGYAGVILLLSLAVIVLAPPAMKRHHVQERSLSLERMARLLEGQVMSFVTGAVPGSLEEFVQDKGRRIGTRITVIAPDGVVLGDSEKDPTDMENHLYRPEIQASLRGETRMSIRYSSTLKTEMMYLSIPLISEGRVIGALRLSYFMRDFEALMGSLRADMLTIVGSVTLLAFVLAFFLTRSVTRPVREVIEASKRVSSGDFDATVSQRRSGEFRDFARGFNAMTGRLKDMFGEIRLQNEEIRSILASIQDGLCVLDGDGRIVLSNATFRRLAGADVPDGRHFWEVVRSSSAAEIVRTTRETGADGLGEISIGERIYACHVSRLVAADRLVVTFHDVTEFRALEKTKRDFVINVSHELKTPLTAIKGFLETMESGSEADNRAALEIVRRNTDRLIAIVEDLIVLSQLEAPGLRPERVPVDVRGVAESIIRLFERRAGEKKVGLFLEAPEGLPPVPADPVQLEGLLLNLVDNAVKYTEKGSVRVRLSAGEGRFLIEVADTGIGIDADHQPHVFERFYVADKSRSKKLGGTGLGLAIVKHIALAHGGTVSLESRLGEGTTLSVSLPLT
jgi:two-component system phosphate regulon sensor histidine kinase PhoR